MLLSALVAVSLACAIIPAVVFCINLRLYQEPPPVGAMLPAVSILIPARNEAHAIEAAIRAALGSTGVQIEVVVMDDASTDGTADIVRSLSQEDSRVRLEHAPPLPPGWNGKQHACWQLAQAADHPMLCFVDADVRLGPEAVGRMTTFLLQTECSLVSGFPRQLTGTSFEWLLLPLIHFVLLGFLPLARMRRTTDPSVSAGCGQFMLAECDAYFATGGHSAIRTTLHDGIQLPRLFRQHLLSTDIADITRYATCRMYTSASQVISGLAKNATEGIATPARIVPVTLILLLGQILPFAALLDAAHLPGYIVLCMALAALAAWSPRVLAVRRFRQDVRGAILHPIGIIVLLAIQWFAFMRKRLGISARWKDRAYAN